MKTTTRNPHISLSILFYALTLHALTLAGFAQPFAATQTATMVTGPTAVLNGMATPNGLPTSVWFQWGTNANYGNQTALSNAGNGAGVVAKADRIAGLTMGEVYHYRLVTSNSLGVAYGADQVLAVGKAIWAWGDNSIGQTDVPAGLSNVVAVAGGGFHSLALRSDGTLAAWGGDAQGQINVPAGLSNVVAIAGGDYHSLALKSNGTVMAWGYNASGQTIVPSGLNNVVAIAGGGLHSLALRSDGTVWAWGDNTFGQTNVPAGLSNVVAVAGGKFYSLALKSDGTVAAWGINTYGQTNVPSGLSNVVAIAGAFQYSLALQSDGTVATWGQSYNGSQTNVITLPAGLSNVLTLARGGWHSLALKGDGTVTGWGYYDDGSQFIPMTAPDWLSDVVAIGQGNLHGLALTMSSPPTSGTCAPRPWGMVAWWPGDGSAMDIIGGNNGTLVNGASYAQAMVGNAFSFDGGAKTGISAADNPALKLTNSLTIEAWVEIRGLTNTIDGMILFRGDDRGGLDPYALAISGGTTSAVFHIAASLTAEAGIAAPVPVGRLFHLAATLDGNSGQMSLYVDGALAATSATTVRPFGDLDPSANPGIGIGNIQGLPLSIYSSPFHGLIDELRVYSRALSANEIKTIADAGVLGLCPAVPPRTATASAVLDNGFVVNTTITDGGYGYTNTPTVRIIGGGGSGAQAVAVVSNGVVVAVNILDAGYGYTSTPLVVIDPPFIPNPVLGIAPMSFLAFSNLTLGGLYQLQQSVAWYWSNQPVSFTATNALYTQMVAGVAGSGDYRLALSPVPAQAFAIAVVDYGFVVHATMTSGGSGYVTSPAVTIVGGGGTDATAVSHISGGVVTSITVTDTGSGYTNTPTIRIAPPPAAAVSPTVSPVMRVDSARLAPYNNYQIQFTPSLGGTWGNWAGGLFSPTDVTNSQYLFITNSVGFFRVSHEP